ncbi:hypothetical protein N665_0218s0070, partial [Sinapis alba]
FLKTLETLLPKEYAEVKSDPLFTHIMAINDNGMGYSARLIHNFKCKQLFTAKKHELWFEFAAQPLRFSLQEFHAVTGLKCSKESKLMKRRGKISLKSIRLQHLQQCHKWSHMDRIRLIYVLMANDEKSHISQKYIKLVMDIEKLRMYPWGLESYDALVESIITSRKKLENKTSYVLDGFTYAFQIWIIEAIPDFGKMLGKKKDKEFIGPRCGNWRGAAKISYKHIIQLESLFGSHCTLHPCISASKYEGVILDVTFLRDDELTDERVDHMLELITKHHNVVTFLEEDSDIDIELSDEDIDDGTDAVKTTLAGEKMERKIASECKASLASISALESEIKLLKEAMEKGNGQSSKGKEPSNTKAKTVKTASPKPQEVIKKVIKKIEMPSLVDSENEKKKFKLSELLKSYGNGELPWHRRTNKKTIKVFDCAGLKHNKIADAVATIVPRIVKDDDIITSVRLKIAIDLFAAASDPLLIERISKFEPPKHAPSEVVDLS